MFNVWLPGGQFFDFNDGVTTTLGYKTQGAGGNLLCQSFIIPNAQAGMGVTFDMVDPPIAITKPPKVSYSSTSAMTFVLKDSDGWLWAAPCPMQLAVLERGWAWSQFVLHSVQENEGDPPEAPAPGNIQAFQFGGADGVHGGGNNVPQTISIAYIAGRTPATTEAGDIRSVLVTDKNPLAHIWKIGDFQLINGHRQEVKYIGSLPFGLQMNGPRNRLSVLPYRGPIVAGYQNGGAWVDAGDNENMGGMLDFLLESQIQFSARHPSHITGPFMHIYLQALWDCEQNGTIDTWVWDGPDGNPAWDGWQYRAFDAMSHTWYLAKDASSINSTNKTKLTTVCTKFADWLYGWLIAHPDVAGVPNDWNPPGWQQGVPFPANSYLDPKFAFPSGHDIGLSLKGIVHCALSGYNMVKAKYIISRLVPSLYAVQVKDSTNTNEMRGAMTLNPTGFEVYGFEQAEILDALAVCKQHPELMQL